MSDWKDRIYDERDELIIKITKLAHFINTNKEYTALPHKTRARLCKQLAIMRKYRDVLNERIDND